MACQRPEITKDFGFDDYVPEWSYNNWRKKNNLPDYVWQDSRWVMGGYDPVDKMQSRTHWLAQRVIEMIKKYQSEGEKWHIRFDTSDPHLPCYPVREFLAMYDKEKIQEWPNYRDDLSNKPYIQRQQIYNWELEDSNWRCGRVICSVILLISLNWMMLWVWLLRL